MLSPPIAAESSGGVGKLTMGNKTCPDYLESLMPWHIYLVPPASPGKLEWISGHFGLPNRSYLDKDHKRASNVVPIPKHKSLSLPGETLDFCRES